MSFFLIASCSTKKNSFVNRKYHNTTAKYNVLYNGNIALEEGIAGLANEYEDNYWELLPIEPLHIDEEKPLKIPGIGEAEKSKTPFEIAEEKAVKTVQKHGMFIDDEEQNKQIDAAYLLLGKSRYYSQRFVPALEAFDFLLKNFHNDNLSNDLRIWKAKTQIRLQNEDRAIKSLRNLLSYGLIKNETKENAHTALAMAYLEIDSTSLAIEQLNKATKTQHDPSQYARNLIILGQLYRQEGNNDSSQIALKKILTYNRSPYKYRMHSYLEQAKNITDSTDYSSLQTQYKNLIKAYENKAYLSELYYQAALMDFQDGNDSLALANLTNSTHAPLANNFQVGLSYEKTGDYYFDKANFVKSGAFYDSVLASVKNDNTKRIRKLKRKRESLEEIITYENLLKHNDSILTLVAMSESERKAYFEKYIAKIKKADDIAAIQKENEERSQGTGFGINSNPDDTSKNETTSSGKWYFYNAQAVGFGKAGFQRIWGNRKLKDNWRLSNKSGDAPSDVPGQSLLSDKTLSDSKKYDLNSYLSRIPSDEKVIQEMYDANSDALYQLGLIYKERFKEYDLAIARLERFLNEKPKEKWILPAKYHLYRIYEQTGNPKLSIIKQEILTEYPDSRFTQIIENPEEVTDPNTINEPEKHYEKVYCDYELEKYSSTLEQCKLAIKQYVEDPIQAKFELLKSYAIYKLEGKKPFMTELEYIVVNYPKTEEAEHAQDVLDFLNGVKKTTKQNNKKEILVPGKGKVNGEKNMPNSPSSRNKSNERENKRNPSSKTKNRENRSNNPHSRPPSGSNLKPPKTGNNNQNNNQNSDSLGGG